MRYDIHDMSWIEKSTPTPFDHQPISGLFFLDGDLIARPRHPDLPTEWTAQYRGLKYPLVVFPSGAEASLMADAEGNALVCLLRDLRLPLSDTRDGAYTRAIHVLEPEQTVYKVGDTQLDLQLGYPFEQFHRLTYDNAAQRLTNVEVIQQPPMPNPEQLLALKTQVLTAWEHLPDEHRATLGLVLIQSIVQSEWGVWFREALTARFHVGEASVVPPLRTVSREKLRHIHLSDEDIARLSDEDLTTIATLIHEHFLTDAFWDELAYITEIVLEGKTHMP